MNRVLPILFDTEMVNAILDGRKTATRRLVKKSQCMLLEKEEPATIAIPTHYSFNEITYESFISTTYREPYRNGDILYVRETWRVAKAHRYDATVHIQFRAGGEHKIISFPNGGTDSIDRYQYDEFVKKWDKENFLWHPSIHMPKEAARIFLKVKDVRVERLQAMTLDDFLSEGVVIRPEAFNDPENAYMQAKSEFIRIWNRTVKKEKAHLYGWDANPWVWVTEFERREKKDRGKLGV